MSKNDKNFDKLIKKAQKQNKKGGIVFIKIKYILFFFISVLLMSCNSKPSPKEIAQFNLDIYNLNFDAVKNKLKENKNILNVGYQIYGNTICYPIHMAIESKSPEMVKLIINKTSSNILLETDTDIWSPLTFALTRNCDTEIIKQLIENGADVDFIDIKNGFNIFHYTFGYRNLNTWKELRQYASSENLNKEDISGATPVTLLISNQLENDDLNNQEVKNLLIEVIECGGNPNYLINFKDYFCEAINYLNENEYFEYKQILLEGMKNNTTVGKSSELIVLLET